MRIGVVSGVFLNYSIEEAIQRIATAGYDTVDIWSGRPHVYRRDLSAAELMRLRQVIKGADLEVSSFLPAFYRYPYSLSSPNEIIRQDSIQYMKECMDNAVLLDSPILLIVPTRTLHGQGIENGWERFADSIAVVCEYAQQYDIKLGLESLNHYVSDLVSTVSDAVKMIEQLGYDNLGIVLDTGHINLGDESIRQAVQLAGQHLLQFHINDNDGVRQQNLIPGEGTFDFQTLIEVLHESGYGGVLSVELGYHYTHEPEPAVHEALRQTQALLRREDRTVLPNN
jgi:protein FrlC